MLFQLPYRIRVDPRARGRARVPKNMHKVSTGDAFLLAHLDEALAQAIDEAATALLEQSGFDDFKPSPDSSLSVSLTPCTF